MKLKRSMRHASGVKRKSQQRRSRDRVYFVVLKLLKTSLVCFYSWDWQICLQPTDGWRAPTCLKRSLFTVLPVYYKPLPHTAVVRSNSILPAATRRTDLIASKRNSVQQQQAGVVDMVTQQRTRRHGRNRRHGRWRHVTSHEGRLSSCSRGARSQVTFSERDEWK